MCTHQPIPVTTYPPAQTKGACVKGPGQANFSSSHGCHSLWRGLSPHMQVITISSPGPHDKQTRHWLSCQNKIYNVTVWGLFLNSVWVQFKSSYCRSHQQTNESILWLKMKPHGAAEWFIPMMFTLLLHNHSSFTLSFRKHHSTVWLQFQSSLLCCETQPRLNFKFQEYFNSNKNYSWLRHGR